MQKAVLLGLALIGFGCEAPVPTDTSQDYTEIVRTGYFESAGNLGDWRTEFVSREDARMDLAVLDSLMAHHYAYNDADNLDEVTVLQAVAEHLPERLRVGDFAMQLQKALQTGQLD